MNNELIRIGVITSAHGIAGELKVKALTDFPQRFKKTISVTIEGKKVALQRVSINGDVITLKLEGIDNRNQAEKMRGKYLEVLASETVKLPKDSYYVHDIIGCQVFESDLLLGVVTDVLSTGSNDVYVIDSEKQQILLPAIRQVILSIDVTHKRIEAKQMAEL